MRDDRDRRASRGRRPTAGAAGFVARFVVYVVVGLILLDLAPVERWIVDPLTRASASVSATLAGAVGIDTVARGTTVRSGTANLDIRRGCDGTHAMLLLLSAVLAFPASWRQRLSGSLVGVLAILAINQLRLVNLIAVARFRPEQLEWFHVYVWQTLIVVIAFLLFLVWGARVTRPRAG